MRRVSPRRAGVAIVTALFVVMVLYVMVTLTVSQAQLNLQVTQHAHLKVQTHFLAQASTQLFLKHLNEDPGWEAAHTGEARAFLPDFGEGRVRSWIEPVQAGDTTRLRIRSEASLGAVSDASVAVVKKQNPTQIMSYARQDLSIGPDALYRQLGDGAWQSLPPPPATYWDGSGTLVTDTHGGDPDKPKYANQLLEVSGDGDGNLYGIWRRGPADEVVRFRTAAFDPDATPAEQARAWQTLPPVPNVVYRGDGSRETLSGRPDNLELLTSGDRDLYVVNQRSGVDTIYHLDLTLLDDGDSSNDTWGTLAAIPKRIYRNNGILQDVDGLAGNAKDVSCDREGNLYVRLAVDDHPDTICLYTKADGAWSYLPPAPLEFYYPEDWKLGEGDAIRYIDKKPGRDDPRKFAANLQTISADPDGVLFARFGRDGIDTIFMFTPGPKPAAWRNDFRAQWYADPTIVGGSWRSLFPPPKIYYDKYGRKVVVEGGVKRVFDQLGRLVKIYVLDSVANNLVRGAVGRDGSYLAQWPLDSKPDTLYSYDRYHQRWEALKPVPQVHFKTGPDDRLMQIDDAKLVNKFKSLGGGGVTDRSRVEYRLRSSFP